MVASVFAADGRFLVGLSDPVADNSGSILARLSERSGRDMVLIRVIGDRVLLVTVPDNSVTGFVSAARSLEGVEYVVRDRRMRPRFVPVDPRYVSQWNLYEDTAGLRVQSAWDHERGDAGIVIALLDTGIIPHADIESGRVLPGFDFVSNANDSNDGDGRDSDPSDPGDAVVANECGPGDPSSDISSSWHGLHMAGVMIATEDNSIGGAGINHRSRLLPVRVLGKCGGLLSDTVDAMRWAAGLSVSGTPRNNNPADVLNLSFGGDGPCTNFEQNAINEIVASGATIVVSAGNDSGSLSGPALCDNVIVVGALARDGARASYSNFGSGVTISVPAGDGFDGIFSTYNNGDDEPGSDGFALLQGTSVAAAQASAVVSLMLSANPELSPFQVGDLLQETARPFPDSSCNTDLCGAGLVDANAAVVAAAGADPVDTAPDLGVSSTGSDGGGSSGGGCSVQPQVGSVDPLFPLLVFSLFTAIYRRKAIRCSKSFVT